MKHRTLLIATIVAAAALAAVWRHPVPRAPAVVSATGPLGSEEAQTQAPPAAQPSPARLVVYVTGEVRHPGVYTLPASARADAALAAAGGSTAAADLVAVNLAEHLSDGEAFVVPPKGSAAEPRSPGARHRGRGSRAGRGGGAARVARGRARKAPPAGSIDLNSANAAELERLPGIGPGLAERIVAFREQSGRFSRVDDLLDVAGMNERKLDELAPYVVAR
jgi:competence protein ComEA